MPRSSAKDKAREIEDAIRGMVTCALCGIDLEPDKADIVDEVPYSKRFQCQEWYPCYMRVISNKNPQSRSAALSIGRTFIRNFARRRKKFSGNLR